MTQAKQIQQFYIPEEQSVYLLSHDDAKKLKDWVALCAAQLRQLGYHDIEMIGKGAYGFVFSGRLTLAGTNELEHVFKFTRINLPQHLQDRLEDEAYILEQVRHPRVPRLISYQRAHNQPILVMERAAGLNLEEVSLREGRLKPRLIIRIADQLSDILRNLRRESGPAGRPIVHGDIKPSNLVFDASTENIALIDWGSSVFAQLDANQQFITANVMELMSDNLQQTNARLGDVYFIGSEQLNGGLSSPRFDEQGAAGTLTPWPQASPAGSATRLFRRRPGPAHGVARMLDGMLSPDPETRRKAGDYYLNEMPRMARTVMIDLPVTLSPAGSGVGAGLGSGD